MRPTFAAFRIKIAEELNADFKTRSVRELSDKLKNRDYEGEAIAWVRNAYEDIDGLEEL